MPRKPEKFDLQKVRQEAEADAGYSFSRRRKLTQVDIRSMLSLRKKDAGRSKPKKD